MQRFEILDKDAMGRICRIETPHGRIETPTILPVINPNIPFIRAEEMKKFGAQAVITNSYIIYRSMREEALEKGVHGILETDMPVMTDSGSYQLMVYGDVEIKNAEIVEFQRHIGSDIIVPLDIPTPPDADYATAESDLRITLEREREAKELLKGAENLLAVPVQGSTHPDLRRFAAGEARKIGGDIYPIGAVVPLMDAYRFRDLARVILEVRSALPVEPIHLFGCGHPMLFAMAVALGCDLFDSAAYALYAKDDRYLTVYGTKKLSELNYFPCKCPVCSNHDPEELRRMEKNERERLIAEHNLYVSFQEIETIKQAIKENSLFELVEKRVRAHPNMLAGWRQVKHYWELLEKADPKMKRKFLYTGIDSLYRPAVRRHVKAIKNVELPEEVLVSTDFGIYANIYLRPVFGPVPAEMLETYPAGHAEIPEEDVVEEEALKAASEALMELMNSHPEKRFKVYVSKVWMKHLQNLPPNGELNVLS
ncbi:tRNA guanosine(15) transglycosylase TgtA [Archaeoglobus fulgidus]|uniref:tRNA-guanine(15) transglycosylase n=1 Tax=Archaeoglobus fulgidus (strain ATCC 49558 / DSM 4304 / JCM 9628 / NBRC 100126 / VC-16) TaxID=224325 RepID=ATGT_ARCFU|nr:tRNA guanosine(15) transglycosylase TgtA [Archaeoglobus fulgidus]O29667.1 RecName: Full=tRNA-guanine(15) transglycosylase; AltName: Full=7-cyano-7-deazaguanine tRNA-ribosyltransferase; AltName: Full=Archaeal tRNA-guanine transglycosylase [Archaeoglobus fulgidus DSM 4304]AAB90652.1 archaeosine tRNA-ribosyltransferase (tgtA) [Archaeoglobus fulgidus DSM 4304]